MSRVLALASHEPGDVAAVVSTLQDLQGDDKIRMLDLAIWSRDQRVHRYSQGAPATDAGPAAAAGATVGAAVGSVVGQPVVGAILGTLIGAAASLARHPHLSPRLISSLVDELDDDEVAVFVMLEERKMDDALDWLADEAERVLFDEGPSVRSAVKSGGPYTN